MLFLRLLKCTTLAIWLACMGWLIRYEAFPHWFEDTIQGYRTLTRDLPAVRDSWMRILSDDKHVGYSNSTIELEESEAGEDLVMKSQAELLLQWPDGVETVRINSHVRIRDQHRLHQFEVSIRMRNFDGDVKAVRTEGDWFDLDLRFQNARMRRRIQIPDDVIISGPLMDAGLQNIRPGREVRMRTFDPFAITGDMQEIVLRGEAREMIQRKDREPEEALRVRMTMGDMVLHAWLNEYGQVLRQETPFGLLLEASNVHEAVRIPPENALNPAQLLSSPLLPGVPNP